MGQSFIMTLYLLLHEYLTILIPPMRLNKILKHEITSFNFLDYVMEVNYICCGYNFNRESSNIEQDKIVIIKTKCVTSVRVVPTLGDRVALLTLTIALPSPYRFDSPGCARGIYPYKICDTPIRRHTAEKAKSLSTQTHLFNVLTGLQINLYLEQPMEIQLFATFFQRRK
jgi:hypothetical protein